MRKFDKKMQALQWPAHFFCYVTVKLPLQNEISFEELTDRMLQKYNTDKVTVEKILVDFLGMLAGKELLVNDKGVLVK